MDSSQSRNHSVLTKLYHLVLIGLALTPWVIVVLSCGRGFDITDESFYLLNYSALRDLKASVTFFGAFGKPIYDLMNGSILGMRLVGALFWFMTAGFVAWLTLKLIPRYIKSEPEASPKPFLSLLLIALAGGALYYNQWPFTPSYNLLALIGLALFWGGLLLWLAPNLPSRYSAMGAFLFAFAAVVVFWAKFSSSAPLLLFVIVALVGTWQDRRRLLNVKTIFGGGIGFAIGFIIPLFAVPLPTVIPILRQGIAYEQILFVSNSDGLLLVTLRKFLQFFAYNHYIIASLIIWIILLPAAWILSRYPPRRHRGIYEVHLILLFGLVINLLYNSVMMFNQTGYWAFNILWTTLIYLSLSQYFKYGYRQYSELIAWLRTTPWIIPICVLLFLYVFGSNNSYAYLSSTGAYFFLLAAAVLLLTLPASNSLKAPFIHLAVPLILLVIIANVLYGSLQPYEQDTSVWAMQDPVYIGEHSHMLVVSESTARYITSLQMIAKQADFQPGTPLIDMTGNTPGAAYILNARAYICPWILGGFPGSDAVAVYFLNLWSRANLNDAWILTAEKNGDHALTLSVLTTVGLDFPTHYQLVGTIDRPGSPEIQGLWKPTG